MGWTGHTQGLRETPRGKRWFRPGTVAVLAAIALFAGSAGPALAQHGNPPAPAPAPAPVPAPPPPAPAAPTVFAIAPTSGPVGTPVTITGTNLTGASAVSLGGGAALNAFPVPSFTVVSSTVVHFVVPAGAPLGPTGVGVTTPAGSAGIGGLGPNGPLPGTFSVTAGPPPPAGPPSPPPVPLPPPTTPGAPVSLTITPGVINSIGQPVFPVNSVQPIVNQLVVNVGVSFAGTPAATPTVVTLATSNTQALVLP